jgi:hypothetical protein
MRNLFLYRGYVKGTWLDSSYIDDYERRVMESSGNGAFLLKVLNKIRLRQYVNWTRLLSFNR